MFTCNAVIWTEFARHYNGPDFAKNEYDKKLARAHATLTSSALPNLDTRAVQVLLTYHGFSPGAIDGIDGERTRAAITAFRTKHRLPATEDHKDLRAALLELLTPGESDQSAPLSPTPATPRPAPDLRLVQSLLEYLGCHPGPVDGRPGPRTENAIAGFQRSHGSAATGEADPGLLSALRAEATRSFGRNRLADTRLVQRLLVSKGFNPGDIDGLVGPRTRAAITAFVQAQGASPTDAVDTRLLRALLPPDNGAEARRQG
jgi:peptidoglycan hydrolase-like protein with peptidoglycan-binding domain